MARIGNHFVINIKKGQDLEVFLQRAAEIIYEEKGIVIFPSNLMYHIGFYPLYDENLQFVNNLIDIKNIIDDIENSQKIEHDIKTLDIFALNIEEIEKITELNSLKKEIIQKLWSENIIVRERLTIAEMQGDVYLDISLNPNEIILRICREITKLGGIGIISAVPALYLDEQKRLPINGKRIIENYSNKANFIINIGKIKSGFKSDPNPFNHTRILIMDNADNNIEKELEDNSKSELEKKQLYENIIDILKSGNLSKSDIIDKIMQN